eukprot:5530162-Pyramimonas_sp.AAC.1
MSTLGALREGLSEAPRSVLEAPWAIRTRSWTTWIDLMAARGPLGTSCRPSWGRPCRAEACLPKWG